MSDRLLHLRVTDAPVLSAYVEVPADLGDRRRVETSLHSMARWLREEADGHDGDHRGRLSMREDIQWMLDLAPQIAALSAPAVGLFACHAIGLREAVALNPTTVAELVLPPATIEALVELLQQQLNGYTAEFGPPAPR